MIPQRAPPVSLADSQPSSLVRSPLSYLPIGRQSAPQICPQQGPRCSHRRCLQASPHRSRVQCPQQDRQLCPAGSHHRSLHSSHPPHRHGNRLRGRLLSRHQHQLPASPPPSPAARLRLNHRSSPLHCRLSSHSQRQLHSPQLHRVPTQLSGQLGSHPRSRPLCLPAPTIRVHIDAGATPFVNPMSMVTAHFSHRTYSWR